GCSGSGLPTGDGSSGGGNATSMTITLDPSGALTLAPAEAKVFRATISPPSALDVSFTLVGEPADASLEQSIVRAGDDGVATDTLHAPTEDATFQLAASVLAKDGGAGVNDSSSISVSDVGFATLTLHPAYAGLRPVTTWTASAAAGTTCAAITGDAPDDAPGGIVVTTSVGDPIEIHDVPVGPSVAVTLRAEHYAWGCADVADLVPHQTVEVRVDVLDQPVALDKTNLLFKLGFGADAASAAALSASIGQVVGGAIFGDDDAMFLLDAMQAAAPGDFAAARGAGWDALTTSYLADGDVDFRSLVSAWAADGMLELPPTLSAHLRSDAALAATGKATLTLDSLGALTPHSLGLPATASASWTSQAMDLVQLGTTMSFRPSALFATAAAAGATIDVLGATSVSDALSQTLDCGGLGQTLGGYTGCDASCLASLCRAALKQAWDDAPQVSTDHDGQCLMSVSGFAQVDDDAAPSSVAGQWLGSLTDFHATVEIEGAANASSGMQVVH
ncbi:MAG TPA: hypothetical protein VGM56_07095, partial [Byssovorax sp.]